jgi:hypothetical protein
MPTSPSRKSGKRAPLLTPLSCGLCQLLDRFGAVYSPTDPIYRPALLAGTFQPVRCWCGKWFLIRDQSERGSS